MWQAAQHEPPAMSTHGLAKAVERDPFGYSFGPSGDQVMTMRQLVLLSAAGLAGSTITGYAGPCSPEIERMQARVDAKVEVVAGAGPSASEGSGALLHRQPTPGSIATAEAALGEVSPQTVKAVREAMARARSADQAGNLAACEQALAEVQRAIGP
jgi:predicted lipid-binding transport protein (Tim44 family)